MAHRYLIDRNVRRNNPTIEESAHPANGIINQVEGLVHSQHIGVTRTAVRVRVGRRVDLYAKWPNGRAASFITGQQAVALIPAEAVRLEAGLFRRSRQHLNRWYGRIVLVEPSALGHVITTKIHGESWSLKCTSPIVGSSQPPRTWDPVNIVVDPEAIELTPGQEEALLELDAWECIRH